MPDRRRLRPSSSAAADAAHAAEAAKRADASNAWNRSDGQDASNGHHASDGPDVPDGRGSRFLPRLCCAVAAVLIGWLLFLKTAGEGSGGYRYRPYTPQDAARQGAIESGITGNQPGQGISAVQMNALSSCMDRELSRHAGE